MNNFDYQMFLNGTTDGFSEIFLQNNNAKTNNPIFGNNNKNTGNNSVPSLYGTYEGYVKGNMFKNLYDPFKNYQPAQLAPRNEQEEALLNLNQMHFAMHEMNLYLDNFPNNMAMINKFNEYRKAYNDLLNTYQSKYGPLEINNPYMTKSPFTWTEDTWPWDRRDF